MESEVIKVTRFMTPFLEGHGESADMPDVALCRLGNQPHHGFLHGVPLEGANCREYGLLPLLRRTAAVLSHPCHHLQRGGFVLHGGGHPQEVGEVPAALALGEFPYRL